MARVIGVHGIAQEYSGAMTLASLWSDAVRDGLMSAGHREIADALGPRDVRVAFFGDLFRPAGTMSALGAPFTAADLTTELERDLLAELYREAVAVEPALGPPDHALGRGLPGVQVMVERLLRSRTLAWVLERTLVGSVKQLSRYLTDPSVRQRVWARLGAEIGVDARVIIGHSLGSVVAYEYLCRYQPVSVRAFITLGSPLGIRNLVFDRLTPRPVDGLGTWPGPVPVWCNIADPDDVIALRKELRSLFPAPTSAETFRDCSVDNGKRPHAVERYLGAAVTGEQLSAALA
jgi:hypothetical protein